LHSKFSGLKLPEFLKPLSCTNFKVGSIPPSYTLTNISAVPEDIAQALRVKDPDLEIDPHRDLQITADLHWDSQLSFQLETCVVVNQPTPKFLQLPVKFEVSELQFHSTMIIVLVNKKPYVSFRPPPTTADGKQPYVPENEEASGDSKMVQEKPYAPLTGVAIQTDIGDPSEGILRSVNKVKTLLHKILTDLMRSQFVFPNFLKLG
jgi:distribution and morphology protein 12